VKAILVRAALAAFCGLALSGLIDSSGPILADAQPVLGPKLNLQLYSLRGGHALDPERARFTWNGKRYVHSGGGMKDVIIQSFPVEHPDLAEYALVHPLADGIYQVIAIDEDDSDAAARTANCKHPGGTACRIETREQVFTFARATAAKKKTGGGLAIRLDDAPPWH
jgi:hypothetical protein